MVLDHLLDLYGVQRKDVLITNLVLCETGEPPKTAIEACMPRLMAEVENVDTIIAAGGEAAMIFAKKAVNSGRGYVHTRTTTGGKEQRVIVTNNPAVVLRESDNFPNLVEDFKLALDPPPPTHYPEYTVCDTRGAVASVLLDLQQLDMIAADIEGHYPHVECIGLAGSDAHTYVITRKGFEEAKQLIKMFLENRDIKFLWHNGIYDVKVLKANDIDARVDEDSFAMSRILDERPGFHSLEHLSHVELGWENYEPESVVKYKETGVLPDDMDEFYRYNAYDVSATWQVYHILERRMDKDTWFGYRTQLIPFFNSLTNIERRGFTYDIHRAADLNEEVVLPKLRELRKELADLAGLEFYNPNSTPQTRAVVYNRWGLQHKLRDYGKKKFSTSFAVEVRTEILEGRFTCNPRYRERMVRFADTYNLFKTLDTQRGTFIEGLIKQVEKDHKLYTEINPYGTVNGRSSSRRPNFQNITRDARDVVPGIRTLFLPTEGNLIVQADYSQAELRTIARLSGDPEMLAIYRDTSRSLHKETAAAFYGADYTKQQYTWSKNINFGVCYLQGAASFAQMYAMPVEEAQAYIDTWWVKFPEVKKWTEDICAFVETEQVLVSPFGFKRRFHLITADNIGSVHREAVNFLPSNIAAQLKVAALCRLDAEGIPIVNEVHDSIIADVPEDEALDVAKRMKEVMERVAIDTIGWDDIPFKADLSIGPTWGDVEEVDLESLVV